MRVCEYVYSSTARRARVMTSRDVSEWYCVNIYGVATISRLPVIIGLFCRIQSLLYGSFAREAYNFKEPTNRSHPICGYVFSSHTHVCVSMCTCTTRGTRAITSHDPRGW